MKIVNFRLPDEKSKAFNLCEFDIEYEMMWDGIIFDGLLYPGWTLKAGKNNNYVQAPWIGYDKSSPDKKISRYAVVIPEGCKKQFTAEVMDLLKPYVDRIKNQQEVSF